MFVRVGCEEMLQHLRCDVLGGEVTGLQQDGKRDLVAGIERHNAGLAHGIDPVPRRRYLPNSHSGTQVSTTPPTSSTSESQLHPWLPKSSAPMPYNKETSASARKKGPVR